MLETYSETEFGGVCTLYTHDEWQLIEGGTPAGVVVGATDGG